MQTQQFKRACAMAQNPSWPMLINAVVAYWLAGEFAYDEIMRYMT